MSRMMFSSDPHFGHYTDQNRGVIPYCNRHQWPHVPGTPEMNAAIIKSYQEYVKPTDKFFLLGDMFFRTSTTDIRDTMAQIPGEKILIRGNHDDRKSNAKWMELGFAAVFRHMSWEDKRLGCNIVLNHDPVASIVCPDDLVLCGHVHQLWKVQGRCINVGLDVWDFKPIEYERDLFPLLQDVNKNKYTDGVDFTNNLYKKRKELVENSISTAPHLGSINK